jgi:hypothetical protein
MKTLFRTHKYVLMALGVVGSAVIISCAQNQTTGAHTGKVKINIASIVLDPGTNLRPDDVVAMDKILGEHRKDIYKIATTENGKVAKKGSLKDERMSSELRAEVADAEAKGTSHRSHQVFCDPCATHFRPGVKRDDDAKKLIAELTPILAKYQ